MSNVVITGASGFIGRALTRACLNEGKEVYAIIPDKTRMYDINDSKLHLIEATFEDYINLKSLDCGDIDFFYHLAWDGTSGEPFKNYRLQMNNAIYSGDAVELAIAWKAKKFIMASTINIVEVMGYYGKDNIKPRYTSIYGASKLAAEMICKTLAFQKGIDINIAVIANSYGPGDYSRMIPNVLIANLLKGKSPDLVEGDFLYDWVYIDEITKGLLAVGEKGRNQKTYYIGHEELRTFKDIANQVKDILNPEINLKFGVYPDTTKLDYNQINIHALYQDTGYSPKADFRESILKTAEWVKSLNWEI